MNHVKILEAAVFAASFHGDQVRKGSGVPYIIHPLEVAADVAAKGGTEAMIIAALLHDTIEDTDATLGEIEELFGLEVRELVDELTDKNPPGVGVSRASRKKLELARLAKVSDAAKAIKRSDVANNLRDIEDFDPGFLELYKAETDELLKVL